MDSKELDALRKFYRVRETSKCVNFFSKYPLGEEWEINHRLILEKVIFSDTPPIEKIHTIHEATIFNVHNKNDDLKKIELEWWKEYLMREFSIDLKNHDPLYQDTITTPKKAQIIYHGKRFSNDFFLKFSYMLEVSRNINLDELHRPIILELGAGHATLARLMKIRFPHCKYIIIDLPETLFFSYANLRLNFSEARFMKCRTPEDLKTAMENDTDFIFVPSFLTEEIDSDFLVDLFINTSSLGEMDNTSIEYWFKFIQDTLSVRYLFLANRFLNQFSPLSQGWRVNQNKCSVLLDNKWDIIKWELEPEYERCPYQEVTGPRIQSLIAKRRLEINRAPSDDFYYEDWYRLYHRNPGEEPPLLSRSNNPLHINLTTDGTIFKIWNSIRISANKKNIDAMIKYIQILEKNFPIEEKYFYFDLYEKVAGEKHPSAKKWSPLKLLKSLAIYVTYKIKLKTFLRKLKLYWLMEKLSTLVWGNYTK